MGLSRTLSGVDRLSSDASEALRRLDLAVEDGEVTRLAERYDLDLLVLFGSASREEATAHDLDLGYLAASRIDHWQLLSDIYRLVGSELVDLVDLATANVVLRAAVYEGIPIHERVPGRFAEQQMEALAQHLDTRWLRLLDLELMAEGVRPRTTV